MTEALVSDWHEIDTHLGNLKGMPTRRAARRLDDVLSKGFELTQAAVHEETGALKESGKHSTSNDVATGKWEGEIVYGGPTPLGDVDYAIYEKERGLTWVGPSDVKGDHDFFFPLPALDPLYRAAILESMKP